VIAVFIAADWCAECGSFSKKLVHIYNEVNKNGKRFEVILCSVEKTKQSFNEHRNDMPWCSIPFEMKDLRENFGSAVWVRGIPKLILFRNNGHILTKNGRNVIINQGASAFPWFSSQEI